MPQTSSTVQVNLLDNFIKEATLTESCDIPSITARFSSRRDVRLLHSAVGCVTESAELLGAVKARMFYGQSIDFINVFEEAGDILWYLAILFDELGFSFETVSAGVISKLKQRYPDKFKENDAVNRDLLRERATLDDIISLEQAEELRKGNRMACIEQAVDKVMNEPDRCPHCGSDNKDILKMVSSDSSLYDEQECGDQWHRIPDPSTKVDRT